MKLTVNGGGGGGTELILQVEHMNFIATQTKIFDPPPPPSLGDR